MSDPRDTMATRTNAAGLAQGLYCIASGLVLSGFGRRNWLRRSTGGLLTSLGATLLFASMTRRISPQVRALALTTAGVLAGADLLRATRRRSRILHLARGALRLGLAAAWLAPARREHERDSRAQAREIRTNECLDEALKLTFPASDPIALTPPDRREALPVL